MCRRGSHQAELNQPTMKIAYFSCQMPYPATHGGLVDDWARLNAMRAAGVRLALTTWYADTGKPLPEAHVQALRGVAEVVHTLPISATFQDRLKRLANLARWPSHVSSRVPGQQDLAKLWLSLDAFQPEAIWLDALYPTVIAQRAAKRYKVPLFYRSHNIEHRYMRGQVARASSLRNRLAWSMNLPHLERIEFETWRAASLVFDISMDDMQWWSEQGFAHGRWLPPLVNPEKANALSVPYSIPPRFDVGYLGNLRTPNNVEGVLWFLVEAWPKLLQTMPGATFLLAGSAPDPAIRGAVEKAKRVTLLENPPDVIPVLRDARVLINPIFAGSGVNVKSVEMIFTPARLVASPQGVAGLPAGVRDCFSVAHDADGFINAIKLALEKGDIVHENEVHMRQAARAEFDYGRICRVLNEMQSDLTWG